ncbi:MAG TPA: penicillin-binding protein activator [Polyangia bacterium]|nr:penicillin-binding protein activator [Polyangia bacterium]
MVRVALSALLLFAACAATSVAQVPPGTTGQGEPLPPPVAPAPGEVMPAPPAPTQPPPVAPGAAPPAQAPAADEGADADYNAARARFEQGDREGSRAALEAFVARHPDHGARRPAELILARLALLRGDVSGAAKLLEPLAETPPEAGVASGARYYLGLADARLGKFARARELLMPFLPRAGSAGPGDEALVELRGALAEATAGVGERAAAIALWDAYDRGARPPEKAYARLKAAELATEMPPELAWRTYAASADKGLARALLGVKAAGYLRAQGDASGAATIDGETAEARRALGFEELRAPGGAGDPARLGLAVPLTGKFQPVGEAAMRAAMLATGMPAPSAGREGLVQLAMRDTALDGEHVGRGIGELTREESVIGVISAGERKNVAGCVKEAAQEGTALLALDDVAPGAATTAFQLIHAPEARVAELARRALAAGARDFALLGPDSASGKRLRDAFRQAVTAGGGRVSSEATYVPGATSFQAAIAAIKRAPPQAVFVADGAERLELIAPALAFADLWPAPWGSARPAAEPGKPRARNILLLATANDLSPRLLQNAGRFVQGALLAPGFYADVADGAGRAFVDAYRAAYGQEPHATEAYAYDAVNVLRAAAATGGHTRADVLHALATSSFEGLTGTLRFGAEHGRVDPPRVYAVEGDQIRLLR